MPEFTELRIQHGSAVITGIERTGDGTPILLLHGVGGNALWFKPLIAALPGRDVIALDMPGHRGSTKAPSWGMEPLAQFFFFMNPHLATARADWGGHSWRRKP